MREVVVAAVQMAPKLGEIEENLEKMAKWIEKICHAQKVDLIVFPELATTGFECGVRFADLAEQVNGHTVAYLAERAAQFNVHVAFGMVEKQKVESIIYNSAVLIDPQGEVIATYRKVHLRGEERLTFRPGYRFETADTGIGSVGLLLGWDLAFPESARCLALQGAELICVCAGWERPHENSWRAYALTRALENSVHLAAVNRVGDEYSYSFFGASMVIGPRGEAYCTLEETTEGYAVAAVDLDEVRKTREDSQQLLIRQPRSYRDIVRMY